MTTWLDKYEPNASGELQLAPQWNADLLDNVKKASLMLGAAVVRLILPITTHEDVRDEE